MKACQWVQWNRTQSTPYVLFYLANSSEPIGKNHNALTSFRLILIKE